MGLVDAFVFLVFLVLGEKGWMDLAGWALVVRDCCEGERMGLIVRDYCEGERMGLMVENGSCGKEMGFVKKGIDDVQMIVE